MARILEPNLAAAICATTYGLSDRKLDPHLNSLTRLELEMVQLVKLHYQKQVFPEPLLSSFRQLGHRRPPFWHAIKLDLSHAVCPWSALEDQDLAGIETRGFPLFRYFDFCTEFRHSLPDTN